MSQLNPLINRIVSNPLTFVPAKKLDKDMEKPASYIVLSKTSKNRAALASPKSSPQSSPKKGIVAEEPKKAQPRSMAEAVAAYTGKKFLTKAEKKKLKHLPKVSRHVLESDEDLGQDLGNEIRINHLAEKSDSESDSRYESASEYPSADSPIPFAVFDSESSKSITPSEADANELDDEDDEEDADFDNQNPEDTEESSSESSDAPENEEEEDMGESADEDPLALKRSLKEDLLITEASEDAESDEDAPKESRQHSPTKVTATPPTSPEDEDEDKSKVSVREESAKSPPLGDLYRINENLEDRGSNGSNLILKNWTKKYQGRRPVGLLNHGVTCYMNAAIQVMAHIPAVQHYLTEIHQGKHDKTLKPRSVSHVLAELSQRMWGMESGNRTPKYINPKKIILRLDDINCVMSEWQQEDSHEYFMSLMSRLQEDSTPKGQKLNLSIMYDIFGGLLNQVVTCQNCGNVSETKQEFYDLSLGLNKKKTLVTATAEANHLSDTSTVMDNTNSEASATMDSRYSIEKSIKEFFSNELIKIDKNDKLSGYYCEKCKTNTVATKKSTIDISPETLVVHLKRFKFNGNSSSKVKQSISYSKYLDLSTYATEKNDGVIKYQLTGVIVHEGRSILSGHYIAHCLQPDGTWSTYDDEYINKINERGAMSDPSAYVLVYTKLTPKGTAKRPGDEEHGSRKKRRV